MRCWVERLANVSRLMLGVLRYWPSFVTAMPGDSAQETTALLNTIFALLGSAVTTFGISAWMESECSNGLLGLCHTVPDSEGRPLLRTGSIRPVGA